MSISPNGKIVGFGFHLFTDAGEACFEGAEAGRAMFSFGGGRPREHREVTVPVRGGADEGGRVDVRIF